MGSDNCYGEPCYVVGKKDSYDINSLDWDYIINYIKKNTSSELNSLSNTKLNRNSFLKMLDDFNSNNFSLNPNDQLRSMQGWVFLGRNIYTGDLNLSPKSKFEEDVKESLENKTCYEFKQNVVLSSAKKLINKVVSDVPDTLDCYLSLVGTKGLRMEIQRNIVPTIAFYVKNYQE